MVADQGHTLLAGIVGDLLYVEVGIGLGEIEVLICGPVTFPTDVPTLDKHAGNAVLSGKVDIFLDMGGVGSVVGTVVPCAVAEMHFPPHPDILHRFAP